METNELQKAEADLKAAEAKIGEAVGEVKHAEADLERAEHDLEKAEAEVREAEAHRHDHEVEIKVDGVPKCVKEGEYLVSTFKALVGVAADRELDIVKGGVFEPLKDDGEVFICAHEIFVSHVRTGGSS